MLHPGAFVLVSQDQSKSTTAWGWAPPRPRGSSRREGVQGETPLILERFCQSRYTEVTKCRGKELESARI